MGSGDHHYWHERERCVKTFFKVCLVMLGIFLLSVLITPILNPILPMFKFEKIFNRLIMVFTVTAAFLVLRKKKVSWQEMGFDFTVAWKRLLAYGFLCGALMVTAITVVEVIWGPRYVRDPILFSDVIQRFVKGMLSGVVVGLVEEFFFRGFVFGALRKRIKLWGAVLLASAFYSLTHFLDNGQIFIPAEPGFKDAVRLLFGYLEPLVFQTQTILPEFIGLFLFGVLLTVAYLRSRSLFLPIGIHAGVVFVIKWQHSFVRKGSESFHPLFGGAPHYDWILEWVFLALLTVFLLIFFGKRRPRQVP
jgi:uncharacterized protein